MSDASLARARLTEERKLLQVDRPFGFYAKPQRKTDGSTDIMVWEAGIIPKAGSMYSLPESGATYRVILRFPSTYPANAPKVSFSPPIFHTNVFPDGYVCLSILLEEGHHGGKVASHWTPAITIKEILLSLQTFLDDPNPNSIANAEACTLCRSNRAKYDERVKLEAKRYATLLENKRAEEAKAK
jgi:ubiquitin-conjugating enzyme E2 I